MADDYKRYSVYNDFRPSKMLNLEELGQVCDSNNACHPDSSCVNNQCVMSMKVPAVLPQTNGSPYPNGNASMYNGRGLIQYGGQCLSSYDCANNGFCNGYYKCEPRLSDYVIYQANSYLTRIPKSSTPMTRCYNDKDCGIGGSCMNHSCK